MKTNSTPLRTALIYAFFSTLWILLSDAAANFFIPQDSPNHILAQTIKGWLFVFASAILLYLVLSRDMKTLQKKQEQIRYQARLVENVFDAIISTDMQFHIQSWNAAAERMYGWKASEVIGHLMAEFVQNEYISAPRESILKTAVEQGRWQGEVSQNHKDGSRFLILTSLTVIQDENGQPAGFIAINHDITEIKLVQEEAAKLAHFPAENPNPVMRVDLDGRLVYANKASAPLLKLWDCEVNGHLPQEYIERIATANSTHNWVDVPCGDRAFSMMITPISGDNYVNIYAMDITERKRAENTLRESEARFSKIFHAGPIGINIFRLSDSRSFDVNDAFLHIIGYSREEVVNHSAAELNLFVDPQARTMWIKALRELKGVQNQDVKIRRKSGEIRDTLVSIDVIDINGEKMGLVIVMDITERKKAEEKLHESEEKFKYIFDYSMIGKSITQPSGEVNVNQAFCEMLGYSAEELQNKKWQELSHPDDIEMTQKIIDPLLSGERDSARFIKRYLHKNGTTVWSDVSSSLRRDQDGKPLYFITAISDITERKLAEEALRTSQTQLQAVIDYSPALISIKDLNGNLVLANRGFAMLDAPPLNELIGKNVFDIFPKEVAEQLWNNDLAALHARAPIRSEEVVRHKDGTWHTYWTVKFPIYLQSDQPFGICAISNDITENKLAQEQLLKTLEELKRSNEELEQFAYVASHDLQEPLRAVAGMVQLLQKRYSGQLDERADEYISLTMDGANRMQTLITDLLEYSRVDRRGNPIQPTDANEALRFALRNLHGAIQQSGATVINGTLPTVEADATQITQLFQNLIGNAIKFHGQSQPQIHIEVEELPDAWHFSVRDNGIGIEPQYFERIFLVFQRLHTRRDYSGTGIGLSICKKIVERHGGRIWVESEPGQGATFHFTIPHRS